MGTIEGSWFVITKEELEDNEHAYIYFFNPALRENPIGFSIVCPHENEDELIEKASKEIALLGRGVPVPITLADQLSLIEDERMERFQKDVSFYAQHGYGTFFIQTKQLRYYIDPIEEIEYMLFARNKKDSLLIDQDGYLTIAETSAIPNMFQEKV